MVGRDGNLVTISDPTKNFSSLVSFDFGRHILATGKGIFRYQHGNQTLLSAYETLGNKDWTFVVSQSLDEAFASIRQTGWYTLVTGLVLLFIVGGVVTNIFGKGFTSDLTECLWPLGGLRRGI